MAISFNRYINIVSGLGAAGTVAQRDLIGRFFTTDVQIPTETVVEFTSLSEVGDYFGITSPEYLRAQFYFGFVSKNITQAQRISFARWANADTAPTAIGARVTTTLAQFQAVNAGQIAVTFGAITETITAIDLSLAADLAGVAAAMQTAIRAANVDANFASCVVTYNATASRFELVGGATGAAVIDIQGTGSDQNLHTLLGWEAPGVRLSNGVAQETITQTLANSLEVSNNFSTFAFVPTLTQDQKIEAATWNDGNNLLFIYHVTVLPADAAALSAAIINLGGTSMTLVLPTTPSSEFHEILTMANFAATNYGRPASVQNFMYLQASLTPTVLNDTDANLYDGLRINYYGRTQSAGQNLDFYQRGVLTGTGTDPVNFNVFANEIWLKDFAGSRLMSLLLSLPRVPANAQGRSQVLSVLRDVVTDALSNGTISVGRTLSQQDQLFISQQSGDPNAYFQVQTSGYWLDAVVESETVNSVEEFKVTYTLIYAKDDVIRKVEGSHILI